MTDKRCFTLFQCDLRDKCQLADMPITNGQFQPNQVGEFCNSFKPYNHAWGVGEDIVDYD